MKKKTMVVGFTVRAIETCNHQTTIQRMVKNRVSHHPSRNAKSGRRDLIRLYEFSTRGHTNRMGKNVKLIRLHIYSK